MLVWFVLFFRVFFTLWGRIKSNVVQHFSSTVDTNMVGFYVKKFHKIFETSLILLRATHYTTRLADVRSASNLRLVSWTLGVQRLSSRPKFRYAKLRIGDYLQLVTMVKEKSGDIMYQ